MTAGRIISTVSQGILGGALGSLGWNHFGKDGLILALALAFYIGLHTRAPGEAR